MSALILHSRTLLPLRLKRIMRILKILKRKRSKQKPRWVYIKHVEKPPHPLGRQLM